MQRYGLAMPCPKSCTLGLSFFNPKLPSDVFVFWWTDEEVGPNGGGVKGSPDHRDKPSLF